MKKVKRHSKVKLWATHTSTTLSITLVLFLLGLLMMLEYQSYRTIYNMQEKITYSVEVSPEMDQQAIAQLQRKIEAKDYVTHVDFISKEEGAKIFSETLEEDFIGFSGYNPLPDMFMVNFRSEIIPDTSSSLINQFKEEMLSTNGVNDVIYQENVVSELYDIFYKAEYFLFFFIVLLLVVSIMLISSTIRISLYSQRETILTMRMVGAKKNFIRRPFLWRGVLYGAIGGVLADLLVAVSVLVADNQLSLDLLNVDHMIWYAGMAGIIVLIGIIITWIATIMALNKHMKEN